jgi:hypothetical protein
VNVGKLIHQTCVSIHPNSSLQLILHRCDCCKPIIKHNMELCCDCSCFWIQHKWHNACMLCRVTYVRCALRTRQASNMVASCHLKESYPTHILDIPKREHCGTSAVPIAFWYTCLQVKFQCPMLACDCTDKLHVQLP